MAGEPSPSAAPTEAARRTELSRRHFRVGWTALVVFAAFGVILDSLHAFKVGFYLDVDVEARRLMWTLAHAHGLGLALLHLGIGATLKVGPVKGTPRLPVGSALATAATVLLPLGFFLGGIVVHGGDPSVGVLLVPIAGFVLFAGIVLLALEVLAVGKNAA
ncbi:MAG: hypothetical protein OXT09_35705 [Myxococcales bacterium]|nr:hypothetical protein [Myxococcales bacterium]